MAPQKKKTNKKVAVAAKKEKAVVAPVAAKEAPKAKKPKVYEISAFFHALIVILVVILYAELTALTVIYFNYEVTIESKAKIEAREFNARQQRRMAARYNTRQVVRRRSNFKNLQEHNRPQIQKAAEQAKAAPAHPQFKCPEPVARKVAFNEAEYAPYAEGGKAVIAGAACFELKDGSTKCYEGIDLFINPVTAYSDEWYNRAWAGREYIQKADERAFKFNKMVKSGKDGAFAFEGLKPGSYYVGTAVCLPETKDAPKCQYSRFAAKVTMKNRVKPTLQKVFP